jgi:hypothetical protein
VLRGWGPVLGIDFSPFGNLLASAAADGTVRLWDLARSREVKKLLPGYDAVKKLLPDSPFVTRAGFYPTAVAFSPDGRELASVGTDGLIHLWATSDYQLIGEPLRGFVGGLYCVAFSPDGKVMAVGGQNNMVQLWDVARRERLGEAIADDVSSVDVSGVAFSADGRFLISAGDYGIVSTDLGPDAWATRLCGIISRNLSSQEWRQHFGPNVPYHRTCANLPDGAVEELASAKKP